MPPNGGFTGHPRMPLGKQGLAGRLPGASTEWTTCHRLIGLSQKYLSIPLVMQEKTNPYPVPITSPIPSSAAARVAGSPPRALLLPSRGLCCPRPCHGAPPLAGKIGWAGACVWRLEESRAAD
jgi:hypothetical protein